MRYVRIVLIQIREVYTYVCSSAAISSSICIFSNKDTISRRAWIVIKFVEKADESGRLLVMMNISPNTRWKWVGMQLLSVVDAIIVIEG